MNVEPEYNTEQPKRMKKQRKITEGRQLINGNRPLMMSTWAQTDERFFAITREEYLRDINNAKRESYAQTKAILIDYHKKTLELLSRLHDGATIVTPLCEQQQQMQNESNVNNFNNSCNVNNDIGFNHTNNYPNCINDVNKADTPSTINYVRSRQSSPNIVNALNTTQEQNTVNSFPESVKYTIIAEGSGNNSDEPIEIQIAEDDGAINLNSSVDSERLEICLASEENVEVKTEYNTHNNIMTPQYVALTTPEASTTVMEPTTIATQITPEAPTTAMAPTTFIAPTTFMTPTTFVAPIPTVTSTTPLIPKKRKYTAIQFPFSNNQQSPNEDANINMPQQTFSENQTYSSNRLFKTPDAENRLINNSLNSHVTPIQSPHSETPVDTENMIQLGPYRTIVSVKDYNSVNWTSPSLATRKLLTIVFGREILSTHSMTGKPSPAFKDNGKPVKKKLESNAVSDIIYAVTNRFKISDKDVRGFITTKCADENKMVKMQMNKRQPMREMNKEN